MLSCELRDKWVAALRSGKYEQGKEHLLYAPEGETPRYCCLGVLCEIAGVPRRKPDRQGNVAFRVRNTYNLAGYTDGEIPRSIKGLDAEWCRQLARNNDVGITFPQIADRIEREVPCQPATPEKDNA